jgi:uncharacterized protein YcbX
VRATRTIARFNITPVKSMRLQHPSQIRLERWGVPENRRFYLVRPDGRLFTASAFGPLIAVRPDYDPETERLTLAFPDGSSVQGDTDEIGRSITTDFFGRPVTGREVLGPWAEKISTYAGQPVLLMKTEHPGDGNDSAPVSVSSTASAQELARRSGLTPGGDSRRFRMTVEVEGCAPHEEDTWVGSLVRLGEAVVDVVEPVGRCVITTKDPDTGQKDLDTLAELKSYRGLRGTHVCFGVYADVAEPGTMRMGDPVEVLTDGPR